MRECGVCGYEVESDLTHQPLECLALSANHVARLEERLERVDAVRVAGDALIAELTRQRDALLLIVRGSDVVARPDCVACCDFRIRGFKAPLAE